MPKDALVLLFESFVGFYVVRVKRTNPAEECVKAGCGFEIL